MRTIATGMQVERGYYFGTRSWTVQPIARSGERLTGRAGEPWLRIPTPVAFALTPFLGALFLVFLPLIGFWMTGVALKRPVARFLGALATRFAATVQPGWQPGEAHLTGKRGSAEPSVEIEPDPLDALEREIAALRAARSRSAV